MPGLWMGIDSPTGDAASWYRHRTWADFPNYIVPAIPALPYHLQTRLPLAAATNGSVGVQLPGIPRPRSASPGFLGSNSGQSPSYLGATHRNKVKNKKGKKRMKTSMGGVHPRATLRRMGWIDRGDHLNLSQPRS